MSNSASTTNRRKSNSPDDEFLFNSIILNSKITRSRTSYDIFDFSSTVKYCARQRAWAQRRKDIGRKKKKGLRGDDDDFSFPVSDRNNPRR